ncbi:MAG: phosphoglucosamine mutase [Bacteroidetes bacterium]|nr:phosphoglucosamine mutase [Bacteroidota bacterium]MCL2302373.1 phosphoglucosamine mutase [Lentimicrobiaceae bacterium]
MALIKSISGIRGTIGGKTGENLTPVDVVKFTSAFVTLKAEGKKQKAEGNKSPSNFKGMPEGRSSLYENQNPKIIVGRDSRISGAIVNQLVCATLQSMGVDVVDVGLSTTPTVEMAVTQHHADGGIIITASHNPMQWNALKLLNEKGEFISGEEGKRLLEIAEKEDFNYASVEHLGSYTKYENAIEDHINEILKLDLVDIKAIQKADFSVVFDAVNSTGGIAIPLLLEKLGVKNYKMLYGEPTGIFPHNPEPLPEHLHEISSVMKNAVCGLRYAVCDEQKSKSLEPQTANRKPHTFDVGFVVDPDVDRLAIVMENGEIFGEEYTLVAIADYVLQHKKGNTVSNLSSSRALRDVSEKHGVTYSAAAVGEVNVVEKMKETHAIIGGEGNGGIILPELHYGRDALVGIALFLTFMAKTKQKCSEIKVLYSNYVIIKNKIELTPDINIQEILQKVAQKYAPYNPNTIDGVKIDFEEGWVHLRASNTEPIIRVYAEARSVAEAEKLLNEVKKIFI